MLEKMGNQERNQSNVENDTLPLPREKPDESRGKKKLRKNNFRNCLPEKRWARVGAGQRMNGREMLPRIGGIRHDAQRDSWKKRKSSLSC